MSKAWKNHSRTIVGLVAGTLGLIGARLQWPEGGVDFDIVTIVFGVLLAIGIQGVIDMLTCEVAKPEDKPLL